MFVAIFEQIYQTIALVLAVPTQTVNVAINRGSDRSLLTRSHCPTDLTTLVDRLLPDLPSYANRIIVRSRFSPNTNTPPGYALPQIILAGRPEFEPLPLNSEDAIPDNTTQVFITTLERQYRQGQAVNVQQYHWLFFTQTEKGWELAKIVSRFGNAADIRALLGQDIDTPRRKRLGFFIHREMPCKSSAFTRSYSPS